MAITFILRGSRVTLIQGPCEKSLSNPGADEKTIKYSSLIKKNADKLYKLIQELIDFRKIETDHKSVHIQPIEDLKDYYNSIFSVISLNNGKVIQQEDKDFLIKILEIIEKNISNPELSVEKISDMLGYSRRNLYRKLNLITDESLVDIIKQYRFKLAEKLLLSTNTTIDEIILETGFHNRGNFYKSFKEKYAMTPKDYRSLHRNKLKETD